MPQIDGSAFRLTPDLRFLFAYGSHEDAFLKLRDALRSRARLLLITGNFGVGKTLLLRRLEAALLTEGFPAAYAAYPQLDFAELLSSVAEQHRAMARTAEGAEPIQGVVLLDDADRCSNTFLTNLQDWIVSPQGGPGGLQFVLAGAPTLVSRLAVEFPRLHALVGLRAEIAPLSEGEADAYIRHRLDVSGLADIVLQADARNAVIQYSRGIPRLINHACARALLLAGPDQPLISQEIAREAIDDYIANASFGQAPAGTPWVAPRAAAEPPHAPTPAPEAEQQTPDAAASSEDKPAESLKPVAKAPGAEAFVAEPQAPAIDAPQSHDTPSTDTVEAQPPEGSLDIPPRPAIAPQTANDKVSPRKALRPNRLLRSSRTRADALRPDATSPLPKFAGFRQRRGTQQQRRVGPRPSSLPPRPANRRISALGWSMAAALLAGLAAAFYLLQAPDGMTAVTRHGERLSRTVSDAWVLVRAQLAVLVDWVRRIAETLRV
jgi:type II secretory pathway predicted ATPase ExeA